MLEDVEIYLETAAKIQKDIRSTSWMCCVWCHLTNHKRAAVYWSLAMMVFLLPIHGGFPW